MTSFHNRNHPLWPFLRFLVQSVVLTVLLATSATNFDETEYKVIVAYMGIGGFGEFIYKKVKDRFLG